MSHARKGKVARLPAEIRAEINQRLYDGQTGKRIIAWLHTPLACDGNPGSITEQNLSEWRAGGYQDWLKSEAQMDGIRRRAELSMRMAQAAGGSLAQSFVTRLAGQMDEQIDSLSEDDLLKMRPIIDTLLEAERMRLMKLKVEQKDAEIAMSRERFQRDTAELFLKWFDDKVAREIAQSSEGREVKLDKLVTAMWGERPAASDLDAPERSEGSLPTHATERSEGSSPRRTHNPDGV